MATLSIAGRQVAVDDGFLKLSPAEQQATVEEIASSFAAPPDKYQQAAIDERDAGAATSVGATGRFIRNAVVPRPVQMVASAADDLTGGYLGAMLRRGQQGSTMGAADEALAAIETPAEMYRRGTFDPREGYNYAKAREDLSLNDARSKTGIAGTVAEIAGGGAAGLALAPYGAVRFLSSAPSLLGRTAAYGADAAGLGGIAGFNEGNSLQERASNAGQGAMLGGAIGVGLPVAGAVARGTVSPFISNIMARINPQGYAEKQVARAIIESGRPTNEIAQDVLSAANEGQGVYNVADAIGNPGQRMLSAVARAPGEGRTAVVSALEGRQGTQGRRVSNALAEGFDVPETAARTEARMTAARGADADAAYGAVRNDATPVDLSNAVAHADQTLAPGVNQIARTQSGIANDSAEAALQHFRDRLTDGRSMLTDFTAVQRVRGDLSDTIQAAVRSGAGNKARLLGGLLRQIDTAMEAASPGHRAANANFAQASRDIEAVQSGREAATRGRTEDTIPAFQALGQNGQQAFRSGYVDPLIANTQGAAFGVNKARPLLNDAFQAEAGAMAPGNPLMQRRIGREQRMFETRNQALGGSRTADNLADHDALGIDPSVVGHIISGNWGGAVKSLVHAGSRFVTGNTPAVREAVANILLQHGATVTPAQLSRLVGETVQKIQFVQELARNSSRVAGGAVAVAQQNKTKTKTNIFNR